MRRLPPSPSYRPLIAGLLVAAAALLLFAWLSQQMLGGYTLHFDEQVRALLHQHANPALTRFMLWVSFMGSPGLLIGLGVVVVMGYARQGKPRTALLFVITVAGAEVLDEILKLVFHRTRPVAFFGLREPAGYSFPSGHALVSCAFFGVLAAFAAARTERRALRWIYRAAAAILIALIGISRIYLGVHYPSDVLAGYAAALVWVFSVATARRWTRRPRRGAWGD
jgi:membrane-associated phospholipid phosphatase